MNIGKFSKVGNGFTGSIKTLTINAEAKLEPVTNATSDRAPAFRLIVGGVEVGAAWKRKSQSGDYLSISFDDPFLPSKIFAALFKQEDGSYSLDWRRPRPDSQYQATTQQDDSDEVPF